MAQLEIPPVLGVVNIHPDHLDSCIEQHCTGSSAPCRLPLGAVTLIRRTGGRTGGYGVIGVWYYGGVSEPMPVRQKLWPSKWNYKTVFLPLITKLDVPWSEDFSVPLPAHARLKSSAKVEGLTSSHLQSSIILFKPGNIAANYVSSFLESRHDELQRRAMYGERDVNVASLLQELYSRLLSMGARGR